MSLVSHQLQESTLVTVTRERDRLKKRIAELEAEVAGFQPFDLMSWRASVLEEAAKIADRIESVYDHRGAIGHPADIAKQVATEIRALKREASE